MLYGRTLLYQICCENFLVLVFVKQVYLFLEIIEDRIDLVVVFFTDLLVCKF